MLGLNDGESEGVAEESNESDEYTDEEILGGMIGGNDQLEDPANNGYLPDDEWSLNTDRKLRRGSAGIERKCGGGGEWSYWAGYGDWL